MITAFMFHTPLLAQWNVRYSDASEKIKNVVWNKFPSENMRRWQMTPEYCIAITTNEMALVTYSGKFVKALFDLKTSEIPRHALDYVSQNYPANFNVRDADREINDVIQFHRVRVSPSHPNERPQVNEMITLFCSPDWS